MGIYLFNKLARLLRLTWFLDYTLKDCEDLSLDLPLKILGVKKLKILKIMFKFIFM